MPKVLLALAFGVVVCLPQVAVGQPVPRVEDICSAARRRADATPHKARIFAAIAATGVDDSIPHDGVWRSVPNSQDLQAWFTRVSEVADSALYQQAFVWDLRGNSLVVTSETTSSSGDWVHTVDYCFRADGTLASVRSELATFYAEQGGVRRIRERRFSRLGKLLRTTTRILDLKGEKVLKNPHFMDQDEPIFLTRAALPFAGLL